MQDTPGSNAHRLDAADELRPFRRRFFVPEGKIYFDGNSLGLLPVDGEKALRRRVDEWKNLAILGWTASSRPWLSLAERLGGRIAPLVGARAEEVVATGTTTVNLHALVASFFEPAGRRTRILADDLTFPSDIYALASQVRMRGLDPGEHLVFAPSRESRFLDEDAIIDMMDDRVVLAVLPSVLYRSGQLLDMERLTDAAHRRGIVIGFDCSHSVGVVPHRFDAWGVDFAFWCGYKYLNGGPGATAFLYVNARHFGRGPALAGWFGYRKDKQFEMRPDFEPEPGAGGWQISSPPILSTAPLEGALDVILDAGIGAIREKSLKMTGHLMQRADAELARAHGFRVGTPREDRRRGGHVALEHDVHAEAVFGALARRGIIGDLRPPNVIRLAPSPLYNTFEEIDRVVGSIRSIMDSEIGSR